MQYHFSSHWRKEVYKKPAGKMPLKISRKNNHRQIENDYNVDRDMMNIPWVSKSQK